MKRIDESAKKILGIKSARIISHYDADGIGSAGVLCNALVREKIKFHTTFARDFSDAFIDKLKTEKSQYEMIIFLDLGSSNIEKIETLPYIRERSERIYEELPKAIPKYKEMLVCDHHAPENDAPFLINPHIFGFDGSDEVCASTIAYLLAEALNERNCDLIGIALAGMIGDKQMPLSGLNRQILEKSVEKGEIKVEKGLCVSDAETYIREKIDVDTKNRRAFNSAAILKLLAQNVRYEILEQKFNRYYIIKYDMYADELTDILNACGRSDNASLGLAVCMNKNFVSEGLKIKNKYDSELKEHISRIIGTVKTTYNIQYFYCSNPSFAGTIAGIGMNYLFDQEKPTIALSVENNKTKVSARGTKYLVGKGLNLALAMKSSSEAVGGYGGGHDIAAGATIPTEKEKDFLAEVDILIGKQLKS